MKIHSFVRSNCMEHGNAFIIEKALKRREMKRERVRERERERSKSTSTELRFLA